MLGEYKMTSGSLRRHTEECRERIIKMMEGTEDQARIRRSVQKSNGDIPRQETEMVIEEETSEIAEETERRKEGKRERNEDNEEVEDEPKEESERDKKRRKLQMLMSEKRLLGRVSHMRSYESNRRKINTMLNSLEYDKPLAHDRVIDISNIIGAIQEGEYDNPDDEMEGI